MSAPNPITNGKVPPWLAQLGVLSGGYFIDSKLRAKRAMKSDGFSPMARIYIYLGLATMGYQQELAVKMEGGKRVPVIPADVCAATGIRRENFRRHMTELEGYGLVQCKGSTKGRVEIYAWAVPRPAVAKKIVVPREDKIPWCPADLIPVLNHYRIRFADNLVIARDDISELERLARTTMEAELSLRTYVKGLRARGSTNKEERNERNAEKIGGAVGRQVAPVPLETGEHDDLPAYCPLPVEIITAQTRSGLDALIRLIEDVAVPVIGESPTREQYIEIHQRLKGASPEHYRARLEAKKKQGKLNSVMILGPLADDCAKNMGTWKPQENTNDEDRRQSIQRVAGLVRAWNIGATGGDL